MTRDAVEQGFERYLADLVDETYHAFDVAAVLRGSRSGRSRAVSKLLKNSRPLERHVVRPKLREYQRTILRQFDPVLDYAADADASFEAYADEVLARDLYWDSLRQEVRGERREAIRERLLARQHAFGDALAPLVAADSDDFFEAVVAAYDREPALAMVEEHFVFSTPLREERDAFAFELEIDPGDVLGVLARALPTLEVEFTDEALRSMRRAEKQVLPQAKSDIERAYEG
ncbi:hypothetical protein NDI56_19345 [Haloarcula sp. S1CR25-12]|uniref:Uncharacterized protein n=1 Tax=Haloarcula saliterrae TaxID=2950534 RepID=A0ABU2FIM4_9EURY|nr:hypothetical protein [Haloarcula sp. S1CR25-12]MDS0261560.1 hypothetical protein [Haloarcula sp. S1CR25-12]